MIVLNGINETHDVCHLSTTSRTKKGLRPPDILLAFVDLFGSAVIPK